MKGDRSIQRALLLRVAVAVLVVSVLLAGVVIYRERGRTGQLAHERAAQGAAMLQVALSSQLDEGFPDHAAVLRVLDRIRASPAAARSGRFSIVAIRDASGVEVARVAAPGRSPTETEGLLPVQVPLHDSSGRVAGSVAAWFEVSAWERSEARLRLLDSLVFGIGIVLATALLLHPHRGAPDRTAGDALPQPARRQPGDARSGGQHHRQARQRHRRPQLPRHRLRGADGRGGQARRTGHARADQGRLPARRRQAGHPRRHPAQARQARRRRDSSR